jgi:hypothetical protein
MQLPDTDIDNRRGFNEGKRRTDRLGELTRKRETHPGQSNLGIAIIRHNLARHSPMAFPSLSEFIERGTERGSLIEGNGSARGRSRLSCTLIG